VSRVACWPDAAEELLLGAAILDEGLAVKAWNEWRASTGIDALAYGDAYRLLPLVYRRLSRLGRDDDEMPRLKALYRSAWTYNQVLFAHAGAAIVELERAGIRTLVLKGGALACLDYRDLGVRPMSDVDVLVRPERARDAMELLVRLGWRPPRRQPASVLHALHGEHFKDEAGRGIDLHWHGLQRRQADDDLWGSPVSLTLGEAHTLAPDPAARLMHVCVHGAEAGAPPPIRWVVDAATVVAGGEVAWPDLVERARRRHVTLLLARTLGYVRERYGVAVPADVVEQLAAAPRSRFERAAYRAAMQSRTLRNVLRQEWFRYRRLDRGRSWPAFARYLQLSMGYDRRRDLARHVVRRLRHGPLP
jgi:hypothetical protein